MNRFLLAVLAFPFVPVSPAHAIDTGELEKAYAKGKANSLVGRLDMKGELRCLHIYSVWSNLGASYGQNIAQADGELGYGYTQFQFHYYGTQGLTKHLTTNAYRAPLGEILEDFDKRNLEKDSEIRKLVQEMGQCAIPPASIRFSGSKLIRAEHFWPAVTSQPYSQSYPKHAKDRKAWDAYADAMATADFVRAANLAYRNREGGDTSTFDLNELVVAVEGADALGKAGSLDRVLLMQVAKANPDRFARLVGMDPADLKPKPVAPNIQMVTATASGLVSSQGGGEGLISNNAQASANSQCRAMGGRVLGTTTVPTSSRKSTDSTYMLEIKATARCELK